MEIITTKFFHLENTHLDNLSESKDSECAKLIAYLKSNTKPWELLSSLKEFLLANEKYWLDNRYRVLIGKVWVKGETWVKDKGTLAWPIVIGNNCTIGDTAIIRPAVWIADNVTIGNGCIIKKSIILPGAKLLGNNMVSDSIIGSNVVLGPGVNIVNQYAPVLSPSRFIKVAGLGEIEGLERFGALIGDNSNLAANLRVNPGTVIGRNCFIESLDVRGVVEDYTKIGLWGKKTKILPREEKQIFSQMKLNLFI